MAYSHRANIQKDLIHFKETVRSLAVIANRSISSIRSPVEQGWGMKQRERCSFSRISSICHPASQCRHFSVYFQRPRKALLFWSTNDSYSQSKSVLPRSNLQSISISPQMGHFSFTNCIFTAAFVCISLVSLSASHCTGNDPLSMCSSGFPSPLSLLLTHL